MHCSGPLDWLSVAQFIVTALRILEMSLGRLSAIICLTLCSASQAPEQATVGSKENMLRKAAMSSFGSWLCLAKHEPGTGAQRALDRIPQGHDFSTSTPAAKRFSAYPTSHPGIHSIHDVARRSEARAGGLPSSLRGLMLSMCLRNIM